MRNRSRCERGIAALAGMALLVGVLGISTPAAAAPFGTTLSDEPIRCTPARFVGPPTFLTRPIMTAKYQFHGSCSRSDLPNAPALNYRLEGSWTPGETNPNKPNASESIEITGYEPYLPDRAPGGRIFMYWTARCNREPWLSPESASCQQLGGFIPDDLRESVPDLQTMAFPKTRDAIPANDRQQFYAQYLRITSPATTNVKPLVKAPVPNADMFTITRPAWNDRVQEGQLVVAVTPPTVGMTPVTQLEFKWLNAPPTQPFVNPVSIDTAALLKKGFPVPQHVTRGYPGRWEVRARASGKAVPGPWSFPVQFNLFVTQQTQSQKRSSPIQQTSPLPSSSVTPPSPIQQTSPLPSSSVMQAPTQQPIQQAPLPSSSIMQAPAPSSSAPTQMRRSPSMIMPRGVEGKGDTKSNETVDTSPESEKKP